MINSNKKLKLLIIGGSGFVSGTLSNYAKQLGHEIYIVTRGNKPLPDGMNCIKADRHDQEGFKKAILDTNEKWDAVIDCICMTPEDAKQDIEVFRDLTKHLMFISTDFVYIPAKRVFPQAEEAESFELEGYGGKKRLAELEFLNSDTGNMVWTIVRPGHIYGPGSKLGCLPQHARDAEIINKIKAGETLKLVGGGRFLQQPILALDLSKLLLSCIDNENTFKKIFCAAGPEAIESKKYYEIIAEVLDVEVKFEEIPVDEYLRNNPQSAPFLCHRIYDLTKLRLSGAEVPKTTMKEGLRTHVESLV